MSLRKDKTRISERRFSMKEAVLVCYSKNGGCGFLGTASQFVDAGEDLVICPKCWRDNVRQVTKENLNRVTGDNYEEAKKLLGLE